MKMALVGFSLVLWLGVAGAETPGPLVDASWVGANSCRDGIAVLDVRSQKIDGESRTDYVQGHIPCAVHTDYVKDGWRAKAGDVPGMLSPVEKLEKLIGGLGIDNATRVVIAPLGKDAKSVSSATRVYWTLKILGHDRVSVLNGGTLGYAKDIAENGATVPAAVRTDLPGPLTVILFSVNNSTPALGRFGLSPQLDGYLVTRIKMAKSGDVVAVVTADGKRYSARQ